MKRLKLVLALSMLLIFSVVFAPVKIVLADSGGNQGGSESQSRQSQSKSDEAARAFWAWLLRMLMS